VDDYSDSRSSNEIMKKYERLGTLTRKHKGIME